MKKRLCIVLVVLGVVAGVFFVNTTPGAPLSVVVTGITNQEDGGKNFYFCVTNHTSQPYNFFTYPQSLSNRVWSTSRDDHAPFGGVKRVLAHSQQEEIVYTYLNSGMLRLQVTYRLVKTPRQRLFDDWLTRLHLPPHYDDRTNHEITTPPTNFPAR